MGALSETRFYAEESYPRGRDFNLYCTHLHEHFSSHLPKLRTERLINLIVRACEEGNVDSEEMRDSGGSAVVRVSFDFERFWQVEDDVKAQMALDRLLSGCFRACDYFNWNPSDFEATRAAVERCGLQPWGRWHKRPKSSSNRRRKAGVWIEVNEREQRISIRVLDAKSGSLLSEIPIAVDDDPSFFFTGDYTGDVFWKDNDHILFRRRRTGEETIYPIDSTI